MRSISVALSLTLVVAFFATLSGQNAPIGYDDTPSQPEGKWRVHDINRPRPPMVTPGPATTSPPPSDAVVLLGQDGDMSKWQTPDGSAVAWPVTEGVLQSSKGFIQTRAEYSDVQLHVEFATPSDVKGNSQGRGNSGVFLAGVFEIQVLDSFDNVSYADGQAAALYGQHPPLVNASRGPGEWQSYDIFFTAPKFSPQGELASPAMATVIHNGVLVQNARTFWGPTAHRRIDKYAPSNARGPIRLQDHQNPVRFRNIWLRELKSGE